MKKNGIKEPSTKESYGGIGTYVRLGPTMEEIGHRMSKFEFNSIGDERRAFMFWILGQCLEDGVEPSDVFEDAAQE